MLMFAIHTLERTSSPMKHTYRSPVKEWQISWFVLGTITLNGADTVVCKCCQTVRTKLFTFLSSRFTVVSVPFKNVVSKTNQLTCHSFTGDLHMPTYSHLQTHGPYSENRNACSITQSHLKMFLFLRTQTRV